MNAVDVSHLPVIVLDEATTGMDLFMTRRVMNRLRAEARSGRAILLTTQIPNEGGRIGDTVAIPNKGRAMASGTLREGRLRQG